MTERRVIKDRRRQPTVALSRYTFLGRRKTIRRKADQKRGAYVDQYSPTWLILLVLLLGLNILDSLFTLMILDEEGLEVNPVVQAVMDLHGDHFWIWKFAMVSFCIVLLCLHSRFRLMKGIIIALSSIYLATVIYQLILLII